MNSLQGYTLTAVARESADAVIHHGVRDADLVNVTVKLLKSEYPTPRDVARLRHEYAITKDLDLPGVVRAYALEKHGNGLALVMEDAGGEPLLDVLRSRPLGLKAFLEMAVSLSRIPWTRSTGATSSTGTSSRRASSSTSTPVGRGSSTSASPPASPRSPRRPGVRPRWKGRSPICRRSRPPGSTACSTTAPTSTPSASPSMRP